MTGLAMGFGALVEALFRTFGPFVIPATVFVVGVVGYGILFFANRWFDSWF